MRIAKCITGTVAALATAGAMAASFTEVDGYQLEVQRQGNAGPVVVFEAGFATPAKTWQPVIDALGSDVISISYSRAGIGQSTAVEQPLSIREQLTHLNQVIEKNAPDNQVILVGHSYGGLLVTEYTREHATKVAGLVLVDPTVMQQRRFFKQADPDRIANDDSMMEQMLPQNLKADYFYIMKQLDTAGEAVVPIETDIPTIILTSITPAEEPFVFEETPKGKAIWRGLHRALIEGNTHAEQILLENVGHNIHREKPEVVANAIKRVADEAKPALSSPSRGETDRDHPSIP